MQDFENNDVIYRFFMNFSRFEFAMKKAGFLEKVSDGSRAIPNWEQGDNSFRKLLDTYDLSLPTDCPLMPEKQIVTEGHLDWKPYERVNQDKIRYIKTVRNNLFHGGKSDNHGSERNIELIKTSLSILNELLNYCNKSQDLLLKDIYTAYHEK